VVHKYVNIDRLIVFSIIKDNLPQLILEISNCIKKEIQEGIFNINELEISKEAFFINT
jgi:hypothetical protein